MPHRAVVPPRSPISRPLPSALISAAVTATTLAALAGISLYTARRILERNAGEAAAAAAAATAHSAAAESVARSADSAIAPAATRALDILAAALPEAVVYEVAVVHGDSMLVVSDRLPAPNRRRATGTSRAGTMIPIQADVRQAWNAQGAAVVPRRANRGLDNGVRVWAPVRRADGSVGAAIGALVDANHYVRVDDDLQTMVSAGIAVIIALGAIAGIGRYRSETTRAASEAQLVAAKEAAETTARSRGEFLANMSHEIRTPLHGVLGMTEALLATPHTEADRRSLEVINRSASSLLGILNDILDYSKLEAGRVDLVNAPFDARALVDDVTDLFAVRADEKGLDLAAREIARADTWPVGDAARIRQVLLNLVGNAVKFTEKGSVQVELSTVSIGRKTVTLSLTVRDTGIGIAKDMQERVFEQFSQAEGSTSRRFGGTGLGLTISRQLVVLMGGTLAVSSVPGEGSEFTVTLQLPATQGRTEGPSGARLPAGSRVVVCTPLTATRAALTELCTRERLIVDAFDRADQAAAVLRRGDRIAAVFAESGTGGDEPHELGRTGVPLIMLTTVHRPLNNSTLSELGAVGQLRRPVRQDHFAALMSDLASGLLRVPSPEAPRPASATPATPATAVPTTVPTAPAPAAPAAPGTSAAATSAAAKAARTTAASVLVVDDVDLNLMVAKAMLGSLGVTVRTASGGEEALDILSHEKVDLVLMDCHMPGLDGYDVTRCVRGSPGPNRETPIVALSASAFAEDKERAIASGMNDFATKPIELGVLRGVLDRWTAGAGTA